MKKERKGRLSDKSDVSSVWDFRTDRMVGVRPSIMVVIDR